MVSLNSKYMIAPAIQQLFRDKTTGKPLSGGKVYFYKDNDRNTLKPVYALTGTPPSSYTYTALPNPVILNSSGAFDPAIYYNPYDADGNIELYYIKVFSALNVDQNIDRVAYPNIVASSVDTNKDFNFVPNGQFLLHNNIQKFGAYDLAELREDSTNIAYGGWSYEINISSSPKIYLQFLQETEWTLNPAESPRYLVDIECTGTGGSRQDLALKFTDVNKFADADQQYTYSFWAKSLLSGSLPVEVIIYKYYGTGGSSPTETSISSIPITNAGGQYSISFSFGSNAGKTIGTNNDDYVQILLRMPIDNLFHIQFTNVFLFQGEKIGVSVPTTTDSENVYQGLAGFISIPDYNKLNIGLPLILTGSGIAYDTSIVGDIQMTGLLSTQITDPWAYCDGSTLKYNGYTDGTQNAIPYSRLGDKLWNDSIKNHIFGSGRDFVTMIFGNTQDKILMYNNTFGTATTTANGTNSPTFTYSLISAGNATYNINAFQVDTNKFIAQLKHTGNLTYSYWNAQTSGFTLTSGYIDNFGQYNADPEVVQFYYTIQTVADVAGSLAGKYFTFSSFDSDGGTQAAYYIWYKVNNVGIDPAPGAPYNTGILVNLETSDTDELVARKTLMAMNAVQSTLINCVAASAIPASSYFTFQARTSTGTQDYYAWFKKSGSGTDPAIVGKIGIEIDIATGDTALVVGNKLLTQLNKTYYGLPDMRGAFPRGLDSINNPYMLDKDLASRYFNSIPTLYGAYPGSFELSNNLNHAHSVQYGTISYGGGGNGADILLQQPDYFPVLTNGIYESRPTNIAVNFKIHL